MSDYGFIQLKRSSKEKIEWLASKYPYAFALLGIIAIRARRTGENSDGLKEGECRIGEWERWGWTEGQYVQAKKILIYHGYIQVTETNRTRKMTSIICKLPHFRQSTTTGTTTGTTKGTTTTGTKVKLIDDSMWDINCESKRTLTTTETTTETTTDTTLQQRLNNDCTTTNNNVKNVKNVKNSMSSTSTTTTTTLAAQPEMLLLLKSENPKIADRQEEKPKAKSMEHVKVEKRKTNGQYFYTSLSDIFSHAVHEKKDWTQDEIRSTWEVFLKYSTPINDAIAFISSIINTQRIKNLDREEKNKCTKEQLPKKKPKSSERSLSINGVSVDLDSLEPVSPEYQQKCQELWKNCLRS